MLAAWACREGLCRYYPDTIARAIEDLKDPPEERPKTRRYEITLPGVMWSEDGTGFREQGGKKERSIRDIKSYERAVRRHTRRTTLWERLAKAIHDLNDRRPRPVLRGRTAREVFAGDSTTLPERKTFRKEVGALEKTLLGEACSRKA